MCARARVCDHGTKQEIITAKSREYVRDWATTAFSMFILRGSLHATVTFELAGRAPDSQGSCGCGSVIIGSSGNECFISLCKEKQQQQRHSGGVYI